MSAPTDLQDSNVITERIAHIVKHGTLVDRFLIGEAAPKALAVLYKIVSDERAAAGTRVAAANSILDRAGYTAKRHEVRPEAAKDTTSMSREELQATIDNLSKEIESRMVDITPDPAVSAPVSEPMTQQELDTYE